MVEQHKMLESFDAMAGDLDPSWRPKWTPTGPVVLLEPNEDEVEVLQEGDQGEGGFESEEDLVIGESSEVVQAEAIAGTFVVSIVGRSQTRTLHRVGECHRQPGVHYAHFEMLGDEPPDPIKYHRACKNCFGKDAMAKPGSPEEESSGDITSSDSNGSEEKAAGGESYNSPCRDLKLHRMVCGRNVRVECRALVKG